MAAEREPGCDLVPQGWRWIDYQSVPAAEERDHPGRCAETIERLTATRPPGWYNGHPSPNTGCLAVDHGGFLCDCDAYNDDQP